MDEASREAFLRRKETEYAESRQRAALQLLAGIDLDDLLGAPVRERDRIAARLKRALERERLRGLRRHWSYDLNRHIALKQALDRLSGNQLEPCGGNAADPRRNRPRTRNATGRQSGRG